MREEIKSITGSEALHGFAQHGGIFIGVEGVRWEHTWLALLEK
jgi:hypothetical protein